MVIIIWIVSLITMTGETLYDFSRDNSLDNWYRVDDTVMGGRSDGNLFVDQEGNGVFTGLVSLENNGGFSSVRYITGRKDVSNYKMVSLRVKGDGKNYQFRIKSERRQYFSYIYDFPTSGKWETIEIPFSSFIPAFRGRELDMKPYPGDNVEEISILIGNKKNEEFTLLIDKIELR